MAARLIGATPLQIAIIGAGGTGSAAARFLANAGHRVTVFEQFHLDHDRGSSYGDSRIIRRTYPDALYTRMMGTAYELWAGLEWDAGEELFVRCGGLTFGRADNPAMAQTEEALRVNGVPYECLSPAEVSIRFPALHLNSDQYAIYQADGGLLRASNCVRAQMRLARTAGAELREGVAVRQVEAAATGAQITTDEGTCHYDRVLVAAGPWMGSLLPALPLPLRVTRQTYLYLQPKEQPEHFAVGALPVWIDADTLMYGFPQHGDVPGVKIAWHRQGTSVDPDTVGRTVTDSDRRPLIEYAARHLPGLSGTISHEKVCLYTNTPDEDFILDVVPHAEGLYFCSGCSGHGFKFTILLGQILASLAQNTSPEHDLSRFSLARFSG